MMQLVNQKLVQNEVTYYWCCFLVMLVEIIVRRPMEQLGFPVYKDIGRLWIV